jgi:hypothetical protein
MLDNLAGDDDTGADDKLAKFLETRVFLLQDGMDAGGRAGRVTRLGSGVSQNSPGLSKDNGNQQYFFRVRIGRVQRHRQSARLQLSGAVRSRTPPQAETV